MERTRIKICGIRNTATAQAAAQAGADAVGLVFVDRSPRSVTVDAAGEVIAALPTFVEPVGLFMNTPMDEVRRTARTLGLSTIQLHGRETPQDALSLRPLRVVRALHVQPADNVQAMVARWRGIVAGVLFDAAPTGEELPGGTGRTFDWSSLGSASRDEWPAVVLAGGLTPDNVEQAIEQVRPWAVDVSSGVESSRGVKDERLIEAFCAAVRRADEG